MTAMSAVAGVAVGGGEHADVAADLALTWCAPVNMAGRCARKGQVVADLDGAA
jgi:hypothetical protein